MITRILAVFSAMICLSVFAADPQGRHTVGIYWGGGGSPARPEQYIHARPVFEKFSQKYVCVGCSEAENEKLLGAPFKPFVQRSADESLTSVLNSVTEGTLRKGDQVLLFISTHGCRKESPDLEGKVKGTPARAKLAHEVHLSGDRTYDLDRLKSFRDALEASGVKLAIVDLSCYSGYTKELASELTCVITGTSERETSFATNVKNFFGSHAPGRSLEEVFLLSRRTELWAGFPGISSSADGRMDQAFQPIRNWLYESVPGDARKASLQELLRPVADLVASVKEKPELREAYKEFESSVVKYDGILKDIELLLTETKKNKIRFDDIELTQLEALEIMFRVESTLAQVSLWKDDSNVAVGPQFYTPYTKLSGQMPVREFEKLVRRFQDHVLKTADRDERFAKALRFKRLVLWPDAPESRLNLQLVRSQSVMKAERALYEELYRSIDAKVGTGPCARFFL